MSSIVKMVPAFKPLGIKPEDRDFIKVTKDNLGALIPAHAYLLSGRESGNQLLESVQMGQIVKMVPSVVLNTTKYTIMVGFNPSLAEVGSVSCPSILPPGEEISLVLKAYKNFSLEEFTDQYTFIVYAID